jgi:hypothetical protein
VCCSTTLLYFYLGNNKKKIENVTGRERDGEKMGRFWSKKEADM